MTTEAWDDTHDEAHRHNYVKDLQKFDLFTSEIFSTILSQCWRNCKEKTNWNYVMQREPVHQKWGQAKSNNSQPECVYRISTPM